MNSSRSILILFLLLPFYCDATGKYKAMFDTDYRKAELFLQQNGTYFELAAKWSGNDPRFLKSIVFPELIRYHQLSDLFETAALEWLYVEGGSKAADFSIGHLQMKPSFIETLEGYVSSVESLRCKYGFLVMSGSGSSFRKQRIVRLKTIQWQLAYLACFMEAVTHRFAEEDFKSEQQRLRFMATAYNTGFMKEPGFLRSQMRLSAFPYGPKFEANIQVPYSEVAVDYFLNH